MVACGQQAALTCGCETLPLLLAMSAISAQRTVYHDCVVEGLRLIFTPVGVEDDEKTRADIRK